MRVWKFINGVPTTMATAKDYSEAVDMISNPTKFGLPAGNYYMGATVERHTMLGHDLPVAR